MTRSPFILYVAWVWMACFCLPAYVHAQDVPPPAEAKPLRVKIMAVRSSVQYRENADSPWKKAEAGLELDAGADLRTGVRSAVTLQITPKQIVTLDRLGTVRVLQVIEDPQRTKTDLGMTYGRTRVRLETGGREHVTTVSTPGATLAVRGSDATIHHDPLFTYAVGNGHLQFINPLDGPTLDFGGDGVDAAVDPDHSNAGTLERGEGTIDPKGTFAGRYPPEDLLVEEQPGLGGNDYRDRFLFGGNFFPLNLGEQGIGQDFQAFDSVQFDFRFFDGEDNVSMMNFSILDPSGFTLNFANPATPDGRGILEGDGVQRNGLGEIFATYGKQGMNYQPGLYTITATVVPDAATKELGFTLDGFRVLQGENVSVLNLNPAPPPRVGFVQPNNDTFTTSVNVP